MSFAGLDPLEVDVAATAAALSDGMTQIVDVRDVEEWNDGHIDGTMLLPLDRLGERYQELDPNRPLILVCRSGRRSLLAAQALTDAGFSNAKSMNGGLIAWVEMGKRLVS